MMNIQIVQTGWDYVTDRNSYHWKKAYTRLFQSESSRIKVPVKCLAWIKEKSKDPECLGIFCTHRLE